MAASGDGGDFGLAAGEVGQLVDAFDGDEGRIHVEGDQSEIGQLAAGFDEGPVEGFAFDEAARGRRRRGRGQRCAGG